MGAGVAILDAGVAGAVTVMGAGVVAAAAASFDAGAVAGGPETGITTPPEGIGVTWTVEAMQRT